MIGGRDGPVTAAAPEGVRVVTLAGRLSALRAPAVGDEIVAAAAEGTAVVVDLSSVDLIDASIARTLRTALARCERHGVRATIAGATGQPLEVLEVLGIAKDIGAYRSLTEAVEAVTDPTGEASGGSQSIEVQVHRLVTEARRLPVGDPRRRTLEDRAVQAALPLARTMALRYRQRGEPLEDLVQVAALGVVRSVYDYDPDRGSGFLAYAVPTILGELRRHFRDHGWTVRPPRRLQELRPAIAEAVSDLAQRLGREPSRAEVARWLGVEPADVERVLLSEAGLHPLSLDAPTATASEQALYDVLGGMDPEIERAELRAALAPLVAALPPMHRRVLALRFGADLTQQEIANRLGTSQMNVSRILAGLMSRFRRALLTDA